LAARYPRDVRRSSRLPWFGTRLFGRDADVRAVGALVTGGERLITLLGAAGVGKTRLAHQIAVRCHDARRPGARRAVWFVDLSAATDAAQVAAAIEAAIDPAGSPAAAPAATLRAVAARLDGAGRALVVLDNCEQATAGVTAACRALLAGAPRLQLLATSRTRLKLSDEHAYLVEPLAAGGTAALALIQDRIARRGRPRPRRAAELAALRAIVARLEGVPLAIELAAARLDVVGAAALLAQLDSQLDALADDAVDRVPRQRTLRNAIAASWALLDDAARGALARLAVFRGGWTLRAATAVLDDTPARVEALIRDLVDRSLVRAAPATDPDGEPRFSMFEGLRQYAAETLAAAERGPVERRHAELLITETRAVADWSQTLDAPRKRAAEAERDNLLAAFETLVADPDDRAAVDGALIVAAVLASIDLTHGPWLAAVDRLGRALADGRARRGAGALVADALCKRAYLLEHLGRLDEARADLVRGIAAAHAARATAIELDLMRTQIHLDAREGRAAAAVAQARRASQLADRLGDWAERSLACWGLALALHAAGAAAEALAAIDRGLDLEERQVRAPRPAIYLALRAAILHELGRLADAEAELDEAIALVRARNAPTYVAQFGLSRAAIGLERGDRDAGRALARVATMARATGDGRTTFVALVIGALATALRGDPGAAAAALAAIRDERDRHGAEPRALHELATLAARGLRRRAPLDAALLEGECTTPLVRFARRLIAAHRRAALAPAAGAAVLRTSADCSSLALPGGARLELGPRSPARRVLRALVDRHLRAPGDALSVPDLAAAGWPGERIAAAAAKNRVHVALAELRRGGLRDLVRRSPRGYFLDPGTAIVVASPAA
jgi:predicted ATPase